MKVSSLAVSLSLIASSSGFTPSCYYVSSGRSTQLNVINSNNSNNRREFLTGITASSLSFLVATNPAQASLLDEYGGDPGKIQEKKPAVAAVKVESKSDSIIEPNLRSNYYYPTNKKRYLPRIKKCNDAIPGAAEAIGSLNWEVVEEFNIKVADNTILPMKLYTSSLSGGGTNVKVSFTKDMFKAADDFEKGQKALTKAIKKKDQTASSRALEDMATALLAYRTSGRLLGPDGGGDIPSVDEIRRSACRVQGRTFEEKVRARDARLAEAASK